MKQHRKNRIYVILFIGISILISIFLVFSALQENINLFYSPTDLQNNPPMSDKSIRAGGLVKENSLLRNKDSLKINFEITDLKNTVSVTYEGLLPDLFKENKGVVATGYFYASTNEFVAYEILAKHDENYVPKEVKKALE
ncbi:MAG: cytochrome c maturation protein CcmE [Gammaproteobacteria bacterium]|nr:MAG: cytochrome c maturation protein CcmE [Gammaproteobacteria bacterium]